jgi:DNA-binding response OmpR family regulator
MKNFKVLVLGNEKVTRRIANSLGHSEGVNLVCENDLVDGIARIKRENFDLAVIDSHFQELATTCFRINCLWNVPLALLTGKEESGWDNVRFLDIDGYISADSSRSELYQHFEEITMRGRNRTPEVKTSINALVVEDDLRTRESIMQAFKFYWPESKLHFAAQGEEAVKIARSEPMDVILMNVGLADKSGMATLKKLHTISPAPVMILTANKDEDIVINALQAGAADYVEKSFRPVEFITKVRQNIRQATGLGKSALYN